MDRVRRFTLNIGGEKEDVDLFVWTRMPGGEELGFEAIRLGPEGQSEVYISGYDGIIAYDYNPEITPEKFIENAEISKNIAETNRNKFSAPVEDIYHG